MQASTFLILTSAVALTTGAVEANSGRFTLTVVHDSAQSGASVAYAPVAGDHGRCFLSVTTASGAARLVLTDGASTLELGPLPYPAANSAATRVVDASFGHAVIIADSGDPMTIDSTLLHFDGTQLVEVARASQHFADGYAHIVDAAVAPLAGLAFHVRGLGTSRIVFVGPQGASTVWEHASAEPTELEWIDQIEILGYGDVVVSGTRALRGQPGFSQYLLGCFRFMQGFAFEPWHVNDGSSADFLAGFASWSLSHNAGILHLGGSPMPGTERTIVRREIAPFPETVLHRTTCPEPWIAFGAVANGDDSTYAFTGTARDCVTSQYLGEAVQVGSDPAGDRLLGVGDAFHGSTVTDVELSTNGINDAGQIAFLARLADGRTLIVRADPIPQVVSFCDAVDNGSACPCGNPGAAGHGCASSVHAEGALLGATGIARVSDDTFTLSASSMPNSTALFFQGDDAQLAGTAFGDGVRCVTGVLVRLGQKAIAGGTASLPGPGETPISVRAGLVPGIQAIRSYQCYYRNAASFCTSATFNVTNAVALVWGP